MALKKRHVFFKSKCKSLIDKKKINDIINVEKQRRRKNGILCS